MPLSLQDSLGKKSFWLYSKKRSNHSTLRVTSKTKDSFVAIKKKNSPFSVHQKFYKAEVTKSKEPKQAHSFRQKPPNTQKIKYL